jgi:hypothetical protein
MVAMRRPRSIATSPPLVALLVLALALAGCNGVISIQGNFGDASITGQVSVIRVTFVSNGSSNVNVTIVTFLNATTTGSAVPADATDVTFCGHIPDRFTVNAVQTVSYNQGSVCGSVVTIVIR